VHVGRRQQHLPGGDGFALERMAHRQAGAAFQQARQDAFPRTDVGDDKDCSRKVRGQALEDRFQCIDAARGSADDDDFLHLDVPVR
jgi:hypothetical protein